MGTPDLTPLEAVEILEHPEKHLQGKISVQPSLLRGAPDCVGGKIGFSQEYWGAVNQAASYLRAIAAGEYKPVVHAHWNGWTTSAYIGSEDDFGDPKYADRKFFRCSKCRYGSVVQSKYCPSCGALMGKDDSR